MVSLPTFTYHPDPVASGSVVPSDAACESCERTRGHLYVGPIFGVADIEELCPWCIADGSAAARHDLEFTDDGDAALRGVPAEVREEILHRTPGVSTWQSPRWLTHCGDAAVYLTIAGARELRSTPGAVDSLVAAGWDETDVDQMRADGDLSAYLFRCRHCGTGLAYADMS
ncbi:UPF0167 protein [Marmoricola endophyticus]|uniref:UPF0167 protein n=1 Tax=Marmoricola endophyticus TaxID=2040280 RepID=A0A917EYI3_9ACTN|nr:CbrC family protein [Marmoricola endophyticus]GGF30955.1 UPF0167 protein [Marmoricola endophyticus]